MHAAARWPLRAALSIVPGRPVSVQSPARTKPGSAVAFAGRGGWPGREREGGAPLADHRGPHDRRALRRRHRVAQLAPGDGRNVLVRQPDNPGRAARDERYRAPGFAIRSCGCSIPRHAGREPVSGHPCDRLPIEHPLHVPIGKPEKRRVHHGPVQPQVHRDDRIGRPCARRHGSRRRWPGGPRRTVGQRVPRHGRNRPSARCTVSRPRTRTPVTRPCSTITRTRALVRTVPAARLDVAARRLRVHFRQRHHRKRDGRRGRVGAEHLCQHAHERRRGRLRRRLIERGQRERIPEHLANARGLAVPDEPVLDGLLGRGRHVGRLPVQVPPGRADHGAHAQDRQPVAPPERVPLDDARRAGDTATAGAGTTSVDRRPAASTQGTSSDGCSFTCAGGADAPQERERLAVAPHQDVLAVVDDVARRGVRVRPRSAAERRARLDDGNPGARGRPATSRPRAPTRRRR